MRLISSNKALALLMLVLLLFNDSTRAESDISYVQHSIYPQQIISQNKQRGLSSLKSKTQQSQESTENIPITVIAQEVTVRVIGDSGVGSGVIIERKGKTYTVLTCRHVIANSKSNQVQILTNDGFTQTATWNLSRQLNDIDLVQLQFTSDSNYKIAAIGETSLLKVGDTVYAVGFPNWHWKNPKTIQNTRDWGLKAYKLTTGIIGMMPENYLKRGYQIGITNNIYRGMSGGPLFNQQGQLVGINGRSKYPLLKGKAFRYQNGKLVATNVAGKMQTLSWAIPITRIRELNKK
ncbi:MAG: serine protease [Nostoc sp.]|uniref:S1 family peptidase n=1 Tax=Nostoc sp. TaxID=1180 RepID=UPI002FFAC6A2